MNKKLELHYSEDLIREAIRRFSLKTIGWKGAVGFGLLLLSLPFSFFTNRHPFLQGFLGSTAVLFIFFIILIYRVHLKRTMDILKKRSQSILEISDDSFKITSQISSTELKWAAIIDIWKFPHFWLLFFSKAQFMILPLEDLNEESLTFIFDRVRSAHNRVS